MGNCAIKPKVLSETGAPAPEELKDSLLEDQKVEAAKSLSNLFLQDKVQKKTKEDGKITPEKMILIGDLKTALAEAKTPAKEVKSLMTETESQADDDQKIKKEEVVSEEKVIDVVIVKETKAAEEKLEEVKSEA